MSVSDEQLIAKSVQYSASGFVNKFEEDCNASLLSVTTLNKITFEKQKDIVVLHKMGGGALPYKVGSWEQTREVRGSLVSIGVYKKHR